MSDKKANVESAARRYADRAMNKQPRGNEFRRQQLAVWSAAYMAYKAGARSRT